MLPASIQITGELLSAAEVQDICESLKEDSVRLLSVRGCQLSDRDFGRVCRSVAESHSIAQLNLNLGVVSSVGRTRHLADALKTNRSLQTLFLHGSPLLDAGLVTLNAALSTHPTLVCLDLGDCMLGDQALGLICGMLPPDGAKSGLRELTLSANPGISSKGWARLSIAVAHSSQLRVLNLDYNPLGDQTAGMLAVAVASSRTLEVLDLEGTGLTNHSAQVDQSQSPILLLLSSQWCQVPTQLRVQISVCIDVFVQQGETLQHHSDLTSDRNTTTNNNIKKQHKQQHTNIKEVNESGVA
ncbi:leucine-rich repeat-containing protein 73 isoform X2 [Acanthochromis polyacanthus]|uniref:leucine-rich repeat-containing protein 73 isoform X2 n=1 Tax=Acanthochromis polyacanthus TaxID=80966 RepID=UPI0022345235|nr:leucine-rich repeat-containing protein 73 isoform X2 [Acanthochromis polyacanthus]XP_051816321.1 leucine-rich repeat-containing protein 73 isoform X2 [Acanthochromis polyacanthus]